MFATCELTSRGRAADLAAVAHAASRPRRPRHRDLRLAHLRLEPLARPTAHARVVRPVRGHGPHGHQVRWNCTRDAARPDEEDEEDARCCQRRRRDGGGGGGGGACGGDVRSCAVRPIWELCAIQRQRRPWRSWRAITRVVMPHGAARNARRDAAAGVAASAVGAADLVTIPAPPSVAQMGQ